VVAAMLLLTQFDKLIMSLRTAVEKGEGMLDKEARSYDDNGNVFFTYSCSRPKGLRWDK
jgi:hypothetical protein